jgi:hypothetical protein
MNKVYCAFRKALNGAVCSVRVSSSTSYVLTPCVDKLHVKPITLDWGNAGNGTLHLSFAILADLFGGDDRGRRTGLGDVLAACLFERFYAGYLVHRNSEQGFVLTDDSLRTLLRPMATEHRAPLVEAIAQHATHQFGLAREAGTLQELAIVRAQYAISLLSGLRCGVSFVNMLFTEAGLDRAYHEACAGYPQEEHSHG